MHTIRRGRKELSLHVPSQEMSVLRKGLVEQPNHEHRRLPRSRRKFRQLLEKEEVVRASRMRRMFEQLSELVNDKENSGARCLGYLPPHPTIT